jgi:glycine cleavage system H lipoate-binding protein
MENNKRCPFLKIQVCGYCSLFPLKKMIPVDQMKTASLCLSGDYRQCSQYEDVAKKERNKPPVYTPEVAEQDVKGFMIRKNCFYHYGHTWVKKEGENTVKIGIDSFASKLLSNIQNIQPVSDTNILNSGKAFMKVQCGGKTGLLMSPIDGVILNVNESIQHDAGIVNREPYDNGWLLSARIKNDGLKWLLNEELAGRWMEIEAERLHSIIRQDIGMTITDGGIMTESLSSVIDEAEWKTLIRAFLLNE